MSLAGFNAFEYRSTTLHCEGVSLKAIADAVGTPAYVYSKAALLDSYRAYDHAFKDVPHLICYSIKANSNLAVIATLVDGSPVRDPLTYEVLRAPDPVAAPTEIGGTNPGVTSFEDSELENERTYC